MVVGVFGDVSKVEGLGLRVGRVYVGSDSLKVFREGVVPLIWVPEVSGLSEGVVDVWGRYYLFAFGNSGCLVNSFVLKRVKGEVERLANLGYDTVMLDAFRGPSPHDGTYFLTTCFCRYSMDLSPKLPKLMLRVKYLLSNYSRLSREDVKDLLEGLASVRAEHVEYFLSEVHGIARGLGIKLLGAVFPYPLSKYVGQEPKILKKYLSEVHVMLYHRCGGAACLNRELSALVNTLTYVLKLSIKDVKEFLKELVGTELNYSEIKELAQGVSSSVIEDLMKLNAKVYGDKYVPIIWFDERTKDRIKGYLNMFKDLDVFAPEGS